MPEPITEEMRSRMLTYYEDHLRMWFHGRDGVAPTVQSDRYQRSIRLLVLRLIPHMTQRSHRVSDFMELLPLEMSDAPEIVADVLAGRWDYSFGYHSIDIPVTFSRVPFSQTFSVHIWRDSL